MTEIEEKPVLVSSPFNSETFLGLIVLLIALFVSATVFLLIGFTNEPTIDESTILFGIICLILFIIAFFYTLNLNVLTITTESVKLKGIIGKGWEIERKKLISFNEEHMKTRRRTGKEWDELVLYTDKGFFRIVSSSYGDYEKIKEILTRELPKHANKVIDAKSKELNESLWASRILVALGIACIISPIEIILSLMNAYLTGNEEGAQLNILSEVTFYLLILCFAAFLFIGFRLWKKYKRLLNEMGIREKF